jgi:hypothetical protein
MAQPRITFFCDLEPEALQKLFADTAVIDDLLQLQAGVRLALLDLSPERAAVVRCLNDAGIPVIAGLFLTMENAPQAVAHYTDFQAWTARYGLRWTGVGLDIELDVREFQLFASNIWQALLCRLRQAFDTVRLEQALAMYHALVARIHADGYSVDSYQFPVIVDVRRARSRLGQRVTGMLDILVDREVLMTYSSVLGPFGPAILWSYAQDAQSVAIGLTGSGAESEARLPLLDWDAFARDLLNARRWSEDIAIFSLEGCVNQGFMDRLKTFDWGQPVIPPPAEIIGTVMLLRKSLQSVLWCSGHPFIVLGSLGSLVGLLGLLSRLRSHKQPSRVRCRKRLSKEFRHSAAGCLRKHSITVSAGAGSAATEKR